MTTDLIERAKAALRLLPVATHDTQDYCEATGPCFQAMTMDREAFEALNLLPDLIAEVEATTTSAEKAETRVAKLAAALQVYADGCDNGDLSDEPCGFSADLCCQTARQALKGGDND